jgi:hypothetical protein
MFVLKKLSVTPSHLSFVNLHDSFGIFRRGVIVSFNIGSFLSGREFSFDNSFVATPSPSLGASG